MNVLSVPHVKCHGTREQLPPWLTVSLNIALFPSIKNDLEGKCPDTTDFFARCFVM